MVSLQPTDARRALPCWDEPLLKATFAVTLISRKGTVSLSNMSARPEVPVADTFTEDLFEGVKDGSWYATAFETTPPVSVEFNRSPDLLNGRLDVNVSPRLCKR
jgi:aminopeptidase 2